jgi:DNA primase
MLSPIIELLNPYLSHIKSSGPRDIMARCPFHDDNKPSFAVNIINGLWICHACGLSGGLADFFRYMKMPWEQIEHLIRPVKDEINKYREKELFDWKYRYIISNQFLGTKILPESVLGMYDWMPIDLVERGYDKNLLFQLGIGFDKRQDRITFPIRDLYGNLVCVSGRATQNTDEPRYKVYRGGYFSNGKKFVGDYGELFDENFPGFSTDKSRYIFNLHKIRHIKGDEFPLVIVEGFKACIHCLQNGIQAVALMGSSMSSIQMDLIIRTTDKIILFLDNDYAGNRATEKIGSRLSKYVFVDICQNYNGQQPDDLEGEILCEVIKKRMSFQKWLSQQNKSFHQNTNQC